MRFRIQSQLKLGRTSGSMKVVRLAEDHWLEVLTRLRLYAIVSRLRTRSTAAGEGCLGLIPRAGVVYRGGLLSRDVTYTI